MKKEKTMRQRFEFPLIVLAALVFAQPAFAGGWMHLPLHLFMRSAHAPAATETQIDCEAVMQKIEDIQASADAMDRRLTLLVEDMNTATGPTQTERMVEVVNELVAQREQIHDQLAAILMQNGTKRPVQSAAAHQH
jgi:hypothetical protein